MNRRQFLGASFAAGAVGGLDGCLSSFQSESVAEIYELEVWNEDDVGHTFRVELFDADGERTFERMAELGAASGTTVTRQEFSNVPRAAAEIRATVGEQTAEKDLEPSETALLVSVRCSRDGELAVENF